eukprot:6480736-Amphidinium_carterae.2
MAANTESIPMEVAAENVASVAVLPEVPSMAVLPKVPSMAVEAKAKAAPKKNSGVAKKKAKGAGDSSATPGVGSAMVVPTAEQKEQTAIQQKFNQFVKYNTTKVANQGRKEEAKHLADLYQQCATAQEKKAFIARWSKQGGSKQNLQLFFQQELRSSQETLCDVRLGHMTAGRIGALEGVLREHYTEDSSWETAIRFLVQTNHAEYPVPSGKEPEKAGVDFLTTKFWYRHVEDEEKSSLLTVESMRKEASSASALLFEELPADASSSDREKMAHQKLLKMARRGINAIVSGLSKTRTEILLGRRDMRCKVKLDKCEQRAANIAELVDQLEEGTVPLTKEALESLQDDLNKLNNDIQDQFSEGVDNKRKREAESEHADAAM